MRPHLRSSFLLAALVLAPTLAADSTSGELAGSEPRGVEVGGVERYELPPVDLATIRATDERRAARGAVPHYAIARQVRITPWSQGSWRSERQLRARWRLRLAAPGALSLNLAFGRYQMPEGGRLTIFSADGQTSIGPFTERDNEEHGELWTPPMPGAELVLDLSLPVERLDDLELELATVHHGYAGFGAPPPKAGDCQVDVACSAGEAWSDPARSVALISIAGVRFCTGFLVNNTALDGRPLFLTAHHCGISPANAPSVVVMWNHQRNGCDAEADRSGELPEWGVFQTGAVFRASYRPTDAVLLELDDPPDPAFGVHYAGWDRNAGIDPRGAVAIHHPNTDWKRISFADRVVTTGHLDDEPDPGGDHLRVVRWALGTTEGGSSGAPLFNRDGRAIGQLHGGYAACGDPRSDWFGRLSESWTGRRRAGARLSDWLDPIASGAMALDGLDGAAIRSP